MRISAFRKAHFNAAHRLYRPDWSDEKNTEVFGLCANPHFHGHNYELEVKVTGEVDPETGFLIDLKDLKEMIKIHVEDRLDHKNLNIDVPFTKGMMTSTENLAIAIWNELIEPIKELGADLHCVKVSETENNYVEYFG